MENLKKLRILNGNGLKLLAAAFMLVDHIGVLLFPDILWLRFIGRFSMPLFAFMIAEGCRYTKNKCKHFLLLFGLGVVCQAVYIIFDPTNVYLGILITFSISTLIIYALQYAKLCIFEENAKTSKQINALFTLVGAFSFFSFTCFSFSGLSGFLSGFLLNDDLYIAITLPWLYYTKNKFKRQMIDFIFFSKRRSFISRKTSIFLAKKQERLLFVYNNSYIWKNLSPL